MSGRVVNVWTSIIHYLIPSAVMSSSSLRYVREYNYKLFLLEQYICNILNKNEPI